MRDKKVKIVRRLFATIALVSIGLGFLKIYLHYFSIFRFGLLDYLVAIGAIVGGLMVFVKKRMFVISIVCIGFLAFEVFKVIVDFRDVFDVLFCTIAIICLTVPLIRYSKKSES
jgi:hypothetical protein